MYVGVLDGGPVYVQTPAAGALTCYVDPQITSPAGPFNVIAEFRLNNNPLANQRMQVKVIGAWRNETSNMDWNESIGFYQAEVTAMESECKYTIKCYAKDDPSVYALDYVFAADAAAPGASEDNCPDPDSCSTLQNARDCYKLYQIAQTQEYYERAVYCANKSLASCGSSAAPSSACKQAIKLKVRASGGGKTNTTDYLTYLVGGSPTGQTASLQYSTSVKGLKKPTIAGATPTYSMVDVYLPGADMDGPDFAGPVSTSATSLASVLIVPATGVLSATAYCNMVCGQGKGDLNGDNAVDAADVPIMQGIIETLQMAGKPPYEPWPPTCLDANGDGYITKEDYICIASTMQDCSECVPVSNSLEICNNGEDDNCDGQVDAETYSSSSQLFYPHTSLPYLEDLCSCTSDTPCEMMKSLIGADTPQSEYEVMRCSSLNGGTYAWRSSLEWKCDSSKRGYSLACAGKTYVCDDTVGKWIKSGLPSGEYPSNPLQSNPSDLYWGCDTSAGQCRPMTGLSANQCGGPDDYWGKCADRVCNDTTHSIDTVTPSQGHDSGCDAYLGCCAGKTCDTNGQCVWTLSDKSITCTDNSECAAKYWKCNDATRTCDLLTKTGNEVSECGTYWGTCATTTCDSNTGACKIVEGRTTTPPACESNANCTWDKTVIPKNGGSTSPTNDVICDNGYAMVGFSCTANPQGTLSDCNRAYGIAHCMKLPPGASFSTQEKVLTAESRAPTCDQGYVAVGFKCQYGNCGMYLGSRYKQLYCRQVNSSSIVLGSSLDTSIKNRDIGCNEKFPNNDAFVTGMACYTANGVQSDCNAANIALTCRKAVPTTTAVAPNL